MPDIITHVSVGFLGKAITKGNYVPVFILGGVLPDILARIPSSIVFKVHRDLHPLPEIFLYLATPLHLPVGILLWSLALALLFPVVTRGWVFANLFAGGMIHLLMDLFQHHVGVGYQLFFPFARGDYEIGLMGSETSVWLAPPLALGTVLFWHWRRGGTKKRGPINSVGTHVI